MTASANAARPGLATQESGVPLPHLDGRVEQSLADAYEDAHRAIAHNVSALAEGRLITTVIPACPAWTVRDLIAHMSGVAADTVEGRFPAINPHGTWAERQAVVDAFTSSQVMSRRSMDTEGVLEEWDGHLPTVLAMLRRDVPLPPGSLPAHDWVIVSDIGAHEQDLRGALGIQGGRESSAVVLGLQRYVSGLGQRLEAAGVPPLRLSTEHGEYVAGTGSPSVSATASQWEFFRALGSRRSLSQLRALAWSGDPQPYLPLMPAYGPRADDLVE